MPNSIPDRQLPSIEQLIHDARAGDRAALDRLLARYRPFVQLVVRCRSRGQLRARVDCSDLVQETLLRAAGAVGEFQGSDEAQWRAWLGRIAEREVVRQLRLHVDAQRRAVGRERRLTAGPNDSLTGSRRLDDWLATSQTSPSLAAMRHERAVWLADEMAKLPDDYREVLILRHIEGLDFPAVAERLGRSAGATRVLWVRALKKLREMVGSEHSSIS